MMRGGEEQCGRRDGRKANRKCSSTGRRKGRPQQSLDSGNAGMGEDKKRAVKDTERRVKGYLFRKNG